MLTCSSDSSLISSLPDNNKQNIMLRSKSSLIGIAVEIIINFSKPNGLFQLFQFKLYVLLELIFAIRTTCKFISL